MTRGLCPLLWVDEVGNPITELAEALAPVDRTAVDDLVEQLRCQLAVELEREPVLGRARVEHLGDLVDEVDRLVGRHDDVLGRRPAVLVLASDAEHDVALRAADDLTDHRPERRPLGRIDSVAEHGILLGWVDEPYWERRAARSAAQSSISCRRQSGRPATITGSGASWRRYLKPARLRPDSFAASAWLISSAGSIIVLIGA